MSITVPTMEASSTGRRTLLPKPPSSQGVAPSNIRPDITSFPSAPPPKPLIRPPRSSAKSDQEWDRRRPMIYLLYFVEDLPLHEVMRRMDIEHNFQATRKQYQTKISQWKIDKKVKDCEMKAMIRKKREREAENPPKESTFLVRGHPVGPHKIARFERDKLSSQCVESVGGDPPTPSDIFCFTPQGEVLDTHLSEAEADFEAGKAVRERAEYHDSWEERLTTGTSLPDVQDLTITADRAIMTTIENISRDRTHNCDDTQARALFEALEFHSPPPADFPESHSPQSAHFLGASDAEQPNPNAMQSGGLGYGKSVKPDLLSRYPDAENSDSEASKSEKLGIKTSGTEISDVRNHQNSGSEEIAQVNSLVDKLSMLPGPQFTLAPPTRRSMSRCRVSSDQLIASQILCNEVFDKVSIYRLDLELCVDQLPTFAALEKLALNEDQCSCSENHHVANIYNLAIWLAPKIFCFYHTKFVGHRLSYSCIFSDKYPTWFLNDIMGHYWLKWTADKYSKLEEILIILSAVFLQKVNFDKMKNLVNTIKLGCCSNGTVLMGLLSGLSDNLKCNFIAKECNFDAMEWLERADGNQAQFCGAVRMKLIHFMDHLEIKLEPQREQNSIKVTMEGKNLWTYYTCKVEFTLDMERMILIDAPHAVYTKLKY